ncbi:uncharacterized protein BDZ83DRAFT_634515 [Colletotrichum acutatum]|uniref:Uncharacterized protein n=1 Tax=Glomerella acutata TaxID=27357 RepID=A0AAD8XAL2_GLOAC|nr:uncharacterized protein BDZ83DRAFT_634515 [Colletotrichum acutatum]KAK1716724.1 hypothetical protein BDZ83DRAFT_634515 [Colletotrichum acutatum]
MTACEKSGSQSMLPRGLDGKRRASCEPEPDLLSIDPVTSLRGSICNRKADRPPKPTLNNSRTLCKQLAKRHRGSNVSYETMAVSQLNREWHYCVWASQVARSQSVFGGSHRLPCYQLTSLDQAECSQVAVKEDVSHSIIVRLRFHARLRRSPQGPKGFFFKREAFLYDPAKTGTFALRQERQGQAEEREEKKKLHITSYSRPMTMAHSVSLREGEKQQQEHGAVSYQLDTGASLVDSQKAEKGSEGKGRVEQQTVCVPSARVVP